MLKASFMLFFESFLAVSACEPYILPLCEFDFVHADLAPVHKVVLHLFKVSFEVLDRPISDLVNRAEVLHAIQAAIAFNGSVLLDWVSPQDLLSFKAWVVCIVLDLAEEANDTTRSPSQIDTHIARPYPLIKTTHGAYINYRQRDPS